MSRDIVKCFDIWNCLNVMNVWVEEEAGAREDHVREDGEWEPT